MSPGSSPAAVAAAEEAAQWRELAAAWGGAAPGTAHGDIPPLESAVVRFHDPADDLARRFGAWGYQGAFDLGGLALFAAGLARSEADAWEADRPHVATRAYADRRSLLGDRILHWAVPWLDAVGRCYPDTRDRAHGDRDLLLALAERLRPAPALAGAEGRHLPGHDAFGPLVAGASLIEVVLSVWSGGVVMRRTLEAMLGHPVSDRSGAMSRLGDGPLLGDLGDLYLVFAGRWRRIAADHPGSAEIWQALAARAARTAAALA